MKTIATASILRPATLLSSCHPVLPPLAVRRNYATRGGSSKRRSVTPFNDDGHVPWTQLSGAEKTARAAQQSFNFGFILVGVGLTGVVGYFLFTEVFSTESKTTYFNRAVDRIRTDHRCLELLGDGKKIKAHGEETHNRWARSRPIASSERTDPQGNHHLLIHFYLEGPRNRGSAHIHLIRYAGHSEHEYKYFYVDVKGHQRVYLENADAKSQEDGGRGGTKLFGIKWS
ncbi:import inner membrane translocase subunit tim-21 [Diaporthe amygdali]|uniref:import inner membrane translocase subunit tim-21 n=1 Tax=Phomopsis amygdali TaxID=1214568 RepID=UPI0022FF349E|nr:import inner membrane translocase subunit tim-21 [Diaporthe amygdali]KAJ0118120.1 import inner membrane translocase subunit tim-21 [Diaporthe amygdali]